MRASVAVLLACMAVVVVAEKRTLVMLGDQATVKSHSRFLDALSGRGHEVTLSFDSSPELSSYGEPLYENLLLLSPNMDADTIDTAAVMDFVKGGGNLWVTASESLADPSPLRDIAFECGVEFDTEGSKVVDHVNFLEGDSEHTTVFSSNFVNSKYVVGDVSGPVAFRGIGQASARDNILALRTLAGSRTSYSARTDQPISGFPESAGADVGLVTSVQARNNARVTFSGSFWMLSDEAYALPSANNEAFVAEVTKWTFQEQGVLRAQNIRHSRVDGSQPDTQLAARPNPNLPVSIYPDPEVAPNSLVYRIKDHLMYQVDIDLLTEDGWKPYSADDVQLEFVMLDPYVRVNMESTPTSTFVGHLQAPDSYGIFKFRLLYRRPGLSVIDLSTQVSVRPYRHNEYERFIPSAFPYYSSVASMMLGFFVFSFFFLFSK